MSRCNPLQLAEQFIGKLRTLEQDAGTVLDGVPDTLEDLLQCVAFGHATRSTGVLDPNAVESFDFDALRDRVDQIFDAVSSSQSSLLEGGVESDATRAVGGATAAAGLWLLSDPAGTFYGLGRARTETAVESALAVDAVVKRCEAALEEFVRISEQLQGPDGADLVRRARTLVEKTCPEITAIRADLVSISGGVTSTRDLARSLCGATSLQARLRGLIASLPQDVAGAVRLIEAAAQLEEEVEVLDSLTASMNEVADDLVAFDEEFSAANYSTTTEARVYDEIAKQFADLCERIEALASQRRYAEMVALEPEIRDVCAIAIATLQQSPESRASEVLEHDARDDWRQWTDSLRGVQRARPGNAAMRGLAGSLPGRIVDRSDELLFWVQDVEETFADAKRLQDIYLTAGTEFLSVTQEFVDQACTGALKRLLFKYGYDSLELRYARGRFGDLPEALFRASTTAGRAVNCMRGLVEGNLSLVRPLTGEQRFALDVAADTMRVLENSAHLVARLAQEIDLKAAPPSQVLTDVAAVLEREIKGALRGVGVSLPAISNTTVSPDGFVSYSGSPSDLPSGIVVDANGFLRATSGASIPDGYSRTAEGYLTATP